MDGCVTAWLDEVRNADAISCLNTDSVKAFTRYLTSVLPSPPPRQEVHSFMEKLVCSELWRSCDVLFLHAPVKPQAPQPCCLIPNPRISANMTSLKRRLGAFTLTYLLLDGVKVKSGFQTG